MSRMGCPTCVSAACASRMVSAVVAPAAVRVRVQTRAKIMAGRVPLHPARPEFVFAFTAAVFAVGVWPVP